MALLLILARPPAALAQERDPTLPVEPGARGTIGGLFLGAEFVMLAEAAAGVTPTWAYAVGGGAGAVGGALLGFASDEAGNTRLSMGLFVGALVFLVPTTIAVLNATSYRAPSAAEAESASTTPWRQKTQFRAALTTSHTPPIGQPLVLHVRRPPTSFLAEYHQQSLAIGVPDVKVSRVYSRLGWPTQRVPDATQVLVPLFRMSF